jgi:hypothetical protein
MNSVHVHQLREAGPMALMLWLDGMMVMMRNAVFIISNQ